MVDEEKQNDDSQRYVMYVHMYSIDHEGTHLCFAWQMPEHMSSLNWLIYEMIKFSLS